MGADNQQERPDTSWIVGFVDGEGCFYVGINKMQNMTLGWQVLPEFRIVQHRRDIDALRHIQSVLECGKICRNHGDRFELRVRGLKNLNKIVAFFEKHRLVTKKRFDFQKFREIISLMNRREHLTQDGLDRIAKIIAIMNRHTTPKYLESSETICQTSEKMKI